MALSKLSVTAKRLDDGGVQVIFGIQDASDDVLRDAVSSAIHSAVEGLTATPPVQAMSPKQRRDYFRAEAIRMTLQACRDD